MSSPPTVAPPQRPRFVTVAKINGWSVLVVAALSLLLSLAGGGWQGVLVSTLALVSPAMELSGAHRVARGQNAGARWLPRSQLWLLAVIVAYAGVQLATLDAPRFLAALAPDERSALAELAGGDVALVALVHGAILWTYSALIVASVAYQGGLFIYYRRAVRPASRLFHPE